MVDIVLKTGPDQRVQPGTGVTISWASQLTTEVPGRGIWKMIPGGFWSRIRKGINFTLNHILLIHLSEYLVTHSCAGAWSWDTPKTRLTRVSLTFSGTRGIPALSDLEAPPRGTFGDNIGPTHAGIIGSTLVGPLEVNVETPVTEATPSAREQIEGHLSALRFSSAANSGEWPMPVWCRMFQQTLDGSARGWFKNLSGRSIDGWVELRQQFITRFSTRRACFKDPTEITKIVRKANETLVAFKERWIVETGFITGVPEVMKTVDEMMTRLDNFVRSKEAFSSTELPKGEASEGPQHHRVNLNSLTKLPKEILALESQQNLQPPRPMQLPPKKENQDKYCDYHGEKGHYINDCFELKRKLEIALESRNLNHLIKDVRQRGRGNTKGRDAGKDKIINMIRSWSDDKKRKSVERDGSWMKTPIVFPPLSMEDASDEPLIIEAIMEGYLVRIVYVDQGESCEAIMEGYLVRIVYVDQGESCEVMFEHCFENLCPAMKSRLRSTKMDLVGFAGGVVKPMGKIELEVVFGDEGLFRRIMINFTLVRAPSPYNVIFERPGLRALRAVSSTVHSMVKFPTPRGIATLVTRTMIISECRRLEKKQMVEREVDQNTRPNEEGSVRVDLTEQTLVKPSYPDQLVTIWGNLSEGCKRQLKALLRESMDVFAWEPADMTGIPKRIIGHSLNVNPSVELVAQKRIVLSSNRIQVVIKVVEEWVNTGIVHPIKYPTLVDSSFQSQIERNLEAYVDDMVIKSNDERVSTGEIVETFDNLQRINMKLNPKKCSFGVEEGNFLGYVVTSEGIRANLKKIKAIADMQSLWTLKEMQSLSGKLAAIKKFLSRFAEKSLPFFKTLKDITKENKDEYQWTKNAEKAFQEMKKVIGELQLMTTLVKEETLFVYVAAATKAILNKVKASGKLAKYLVKLGAYNITYEPRNSIKAGVQNKDDVEKWTLFTDGASKSKGSRAGLVLISPSGVEFTYALLLNFISTNNKEEYEALLAGLRMMRKMKVEDINVKVNSKLVANYVIREIYMGSCGMHIGARFVVAKAISQGYYWPTMHKDVRNVTQKCDSCQGMDILGPLPQASGKLKFVIVAIDYFTKWIKAKPLASITGKDVKKFVWDNSMCWFGLPWIIVTDNET
nr:reverse transcriptase domain-containing protein [Tanacetum cinerariifolium]